MQSRTKEQLQRYAQTYLGIDPRTVNVTFPWNRLFEVYVDVHAQPDVSLESDVRQGLRQKELDRLAAQQEAARKALEAEKQKTVKDKNAKIDPKVKEELEQAEQAARDNYRKAPLLLIVAGESFSYLQQSRVGGSPCEAKTE